MELTEQKSYFWLSLAPISTQRKNTLLGIYNVKEIWENFKADEKIKNFLGEKAYKTLENYRDLHFIDMQMEILYKNNVTLLTPADKAFPEKLAQSEVNPPIALYCRGDLKLLSSDSIAVVGSRSCSRYGKEVTEKLVYDLCSNGLTVVSGLATGIDTYAHETALKCGGKTIAVLGNGLGRVSPASNAKLFEQISMSGAVISEYTYSFEGSKYSFPERNRIISGLSKGVLVIEAGEKSGALITASYAAEQNREVFAVPGNINSFKSTGCNNLIKEGCGKLTACINDILEELDYKSLQKTKKFTAIQLDIYEEKIYNALQENPKNFDELAVDCGLPLSDLSATLSVLEIRGIVKRLNSNVYKLEE